MGNLRESAAALRIMSDDLAPSHVSDLLGCLPTVSFAKGDELVGRKTGQKRIATFGLWLLRARTHEPESIDEQIAEIFAKLTDDLEVWKAISERYTVSLFCGLFMACYNDGLSISVPSLMALASRNISLDLDIYGPSGDESAPVTGV